MRHRIVAGLLILQLFFTGYVAGDAAAQVARDAAQPPNILFVFTDDQALSCVGCLGNEVIQTPNLDRLASQGVLFTNAFVTTAICCSNRACILTGQYMRRHGIEDFKKPLSSKALAETYPVLLRNAGYRTGFLGKYAVGRPDPEIKHLSLPADQFDFWYGFPQSINFLQETETGPRYLTTRMEEEAVQFLKSQPRNRPFCLTVAIKEPHGPTNFFDPEVTDAYQDVHIPPPKTFSREHFQAMPEFVRKSLNGKQAPERFDNPEQFQRQVRTTYRLITRADLALGRLLEALKQSDLDQNTVVIFSSDHGSLLGAHGLTGKWLMYEESIRVPLIIYDPRLPSELRNRRNHEMVLSIDLAPTMLAMACAIIPDAMQGRNLMPLVEGREVASRTEFYYEHTFTNPPEQPIAKSEGVRTRDWKYIRYPEYDPPYEQLFDLEHDPHEEHDFARATQHVEKLNDLRQRCDNYGTTLR